MVVQRQSLTAAGHISNICSFTSTVTGVIVSIIIKYTGRYKQLIILGGGIYVMGLGVMFRCTTMKSSVGQMVAAQIAIGLGIGMLNVPTQLAVQATAGPNLVSAATAAFLMVVEMGHATGSAISGALWNRLLPQKLRQYLPEEARDRVDEIVGNMTAVMEYKAETPERDAIDRAYQETLATLLTIAVCGCIPVILAGLWLKAYQLDNMEKHDTSHNIVEKDESLYHRSGSIWRVRNWSNITARVEL